MNSVFRDKTVSMSLNLCKACQLLLISTANVVWDSKEFKNEDNRSICCPCCLGCFRRSTVSVLARSIINQVQERSFQERIIYLKVVAHEIFILSRNVCRLVTQRSIEKIGIPGNIEAGMAALLIGCISELYPELNVVYDYKEPEVGSIEARIDLSPRSPTFPLAYGRLLDPYFSHKRRALTSSSSLLSSFALTETTAAMLTSNDFLRLSEQCKDDALKDATAFNQMAESLKALGKIIDVNDALTDRNRSDRSEPIICSANVVVGRCYLYGRYNKYARDVPQSEWLIEAPKLSLIHTNTSQFVANNESESDIKIGSVPEPEPPLKRQKKTTEMYMKNTTSNLQRKGRASVQEIISEHVQKVFGVHRVDFHACGREDIDVRCLGNGRPFVLKIHGSERVVDVELLKQVEGAINSAKGLNKHFDVSVRNLSACDISIWTGMQALAEQKRKSYTCVVCCYDVEGAAFATEDAGRPYTVSDEALREVCALSNRDIDEWGQKCIRLAQKTPLRVLHRRAALTREKFVYNLTTERLSDSAFLLHLTTSAGTYVKEFVHGDFGRTIPNVSAILKCRALILQLDVTGLHDDMPGACADTVADANAVIGNK